MNLHYIDIAIVVGYLVFCIIIGLLKYGKIKNIRDYTLGTKSFPTSVLIATTFATAVSARLIIGNIGKAYELGFIFITSLAFVPISWLVTAKIFAPNLENFKKLKFMSLSDIMEHWYGDIGRWVSNVLSVIKTIGVITVSAITIGYLLHYFFNISENVGMIIGVAVVTLYSAFGGIAAVAFTDVFQFLIFFIALPIACASGYEASGGIENIVAKLPREHVVINTDKIALFLSLILFSSVPDTAIPYVQRALITKDEKQFIISFKAVGLLMIPMLLIASLIGLITYTANPNINPNTALYHFMDSFLYTGIKGLLIAGLLAVIMSTQDSYLNTTSALISRDICKKIWPSLTDKQELLIARISCVTMSALSVLAIFFKTGILDIAWLSNNFWMPLVTFPLLAGLLGIRISNKSFNILIILSLSTTIITRFFTGTFDTRSLAVGVITSMIVLFLGSRKYKKENPHLFPAKLIKKPLVERLSAAAKVNNFSMTIMHMISFILAINFIFAAVFINAQSFCFMNVAFVGSSIIFIMLLLRDSWSDELKKYISPLWKMTLIFSLLAIPSYILFATSFNFLWILNFVMSVALFYVLTNAIQLILLLPLSMVAAYFINITMPYVGSELLTVKMLPICSCFFFIIAIMQKIYNAIYIKKEVISQLEYLVDQRTKELNQALDTKERFLRNVSHEIRTPLHVILGMASAVRDQWHKISEDKKQSLVGKMADSGDQLMDLVSNILDVSKMSAGKFSVYKEKHDFIKITKETLAEFENPLKKDFISLDTQNLDTITCNCDKDRIAQVIRNLVSNATKYGNNKPINVQVSVKDDQYVELLVIDQGVGVPESDLKRIFDSFEESTRTRTNAGGTGLGLAISKEIIESHDGNIFVRNNQNGGAIFGFKIPAADAEIADDKIISIKTQNSDEKTILIVDDQKSILDTAELILPSFGYKVLTAEGGFAALEVLKKETPDLILLDVMMPDLGGAEVLREIRKSSKWCNIPVIIQSGYDSIKNKEIAEVHKLGIQGFITKPYKIKQLKKVIDEITLNLKVEA